MIITVYFSRLIKITRIVTIFKSGNFNDPKNYRPFSLLPTFSKIPEEIINHRIISFFNKYEILHPSHHGLRTNHNTTTAAIKVLEYITI